MELHEARYFLTLGETLNFTRAAEACHVAQPALTRAIQKMEHEFGGMLFSRERNKIRLTELGCAVRPHLAAMISDAHKAADAAQDFLRSDAVRIRFGVMESVGPVRFLPFLSDFRDRYPGIEIGLAQYPYDRLQTMLLRGDLDVALATHPNGIAPPLVGEALYAERFAVACPHGHRLANRHSIHLADIDGETQLSTTVGEPEDWVLSMVAAGMGVCVRPEFSLPVPGVVIRPIADPLPARDVCITTVSGRRRTLPVTTFIQAVRQHPWAL
ncbi:MAG: LysR family transcriptional regulator [Rhodospirillales bacterium]